MFFLWPDEDVKVGGPDQGERCVVLLLVAVVVVGVVVRVVLVAVVVVGVVVRVVLVFGMRGVLEPVHAEVVTVLVLQLLRLVMGVVFIVLEDDSKVEVSIALVVVKEVVVVLASVVTVVGIAVEMVVVTAIGVDITVAGIIGEDDWAILAWLEV